MTDPMTTETATMFMRQRDDAAAEVDRLREALLELHSAGLALVPHLGYIDAGVSLRWDEAMGAADELLKGLGE